MEKFAGLNRHPMIIGPVVRIIYDDEANLILDSMVVDNTNSSDSLQRMEYGKGVC